MKKYFLIFGLLLIVGLATVALNSCKEDDKTKEEVTDKDKSSDKDNQNGNNS